jgi:FPC/CPF motif-containing protein YcgG
MKSLPPNCANSSWGMFDNDGKKKDYFCCHQGKVGLKSQNYKPGICIDADQNVAVTQLANPVSSIS